MVGHDLLKDLAFWDQVRRLERPGHNITAGTADSGDEFDILGGVCFLGISIILMGIFCRFRTVRRSCCRVNARDDPELPQHGDKLPNKAKSAHTKRQQAILELFETSQVTMVSNDNTAMAMGHIRISNSRKMEKAHHIVLFSESVKRRYFARSRRGLYRRH
jgi:hypothetical protein